MIFSNFLRTYDGYKQHSESDFAYLNRSRRDDSKCIRETLNLWFEKYPDNEKTDLCSRVRSSDNYQHSSATFELYIHALLSNLGYKIEVHPETNNSKGSHPDFLVCDSEGFEFYVEAVQSTGIKQDERSGENRLKVVLDCINKIISYDYFLKVNYNGLPPSSPSSKKLKSELEKWLSNLDYKSVCDISSREGLENLPKYTFTHEGWKANFSVIPRSPEHRDVPLQSIIGMLSPGAKWSNPEENIRKTLLKKGKDYGKLDRPLLIAITAKGPGSDRISVMEALFGKEQFIFTRGSDTNEPEMRRAANGLWYGPEGIRYKRISGVLIGFGISPWTFGVREMTLYKNPWANSKLGGAIFSLPFAVPSENKMRWHPGMHPKEILKLSLGYPGIES